jgi:hypothetical protein
MNKIFADKLALQRAAVRKARAPSVEAFLAEAGEDSKLEWIPGAKPGSSLSLPLVVDDDLPPVRMRRRRWPLWAGAAGILAAAGAVVAVALPSARPALVEASADARVVLRGPDGVLVLLDGEPTVVTPAELKVPPRRPASIVLRRPGFVDRAVELPPLAAGATHVIDVTLAPAP